MKPEGRGILELLRGDILMPEIIWDSPDEPGWDPSLNRILMSGKHYYKKRAPMVFAHELGHQRYDQTLGDTDPLIDMYQERDAWRFALSKLPPEEIDLDFLEYALGGYVNEVEEQYGEGPELDSAKKLKNEMMSLARRKKGV